MQQKNIAILGAGESGVGAALLAHAHGYGVFVSDKSKIKDRYRKELQENNIDYEEENHDEIRILQSELIVKSPGIPDDIALIQKAKAKQIEVIGELEFGFRYARHSRMILITGTNGKTTTTLLTYHLMKEAGLDVGLAGNVGTSLARQVMNSSHQWYVIEASSFQLDNMSQFKADVAVILNITPDHLDRYNYHFPNYINSKFSILRNMTADNVFIYFQGAEVLNREVSHRNVSPLHLPISINQPLKAGSWMTNGLLHFSLPGVEYQIPVEKVPLQGNHNYVNVMAAVTIALQAGAQSDAVAEALKSFVNVPHRMEKIAVIDQVAFVNDSKATNVDAVYYALESFKNSLVWIAGGEDKGNDYHQIKELVTQKVKALICLGKDNDKLKDFFGGIVSQIEETTSTKEAIAMAYQLATAGDTVLLSPACASFDLFKNYEDRGNQFRQSVLSFKQEKEKS